MGRWRNIWQAIRGYDAAQDSRASSWAAAGSSAAVRGDASAVERSGELLAANGWKAEQRGRIVVHGGCGTA